MAEPVLDQLNLVVRDMARSIGFYRAIGLEIPDDSVWRTATGGHHVEIKTANGFEFALDSQALAAVYNSGWREFRGEGDRAVIGFRLPDAKAVDTVYDHIVELGHGSAQPPYYTFWGSRYAVVVDPDGNQVGLMSPPDPAHRSEGPEI